MTCTGCGTGTPRINNGDPLPGQSDDGNTWCSVSDFSYLDDDEVDPEAFPHPMSGYGGPEHEEHPLSQGSLQVETEPSDSPLGQIEVYLGKLQVTGADGSCQPTSGGCEEDSPCTWVVTHVWVIRYRYSFLDIENDPGEAGVLALNLPPSVSQTALSGSLESTTLSTEVTRRIEPGVVDLIEYVVDTTLTHEIEVDVKCDSSGVQTLAYDATGAAGAGYNIITPNDWTGGITREADGVQEIELGLPCNPCKTAGGTVEPAQQTQSSSPYLQVREGED